MLVLCDGRLRSQKGGFEGYRREVLRRIASQAEEEERRVRVIADARQRKRREVLHRRLTTA